MRRPIRTAINLSSKQPSVRVRNGRLIKFETHEMDVLRNNPPFVFFFNFNFPCQNGAARQACLGGSQAMACAGPSGQQVEFAADVNSSSFFASALLPFSMQHPSPPSSLHTAACVSHSAHLQHNFILAQGNYTTHLLFSPARMHLCGRCRSSAPSYQHPNLGTTLGCHSFSSLP